jgi:hypothetical protein
LLQTDGLGDGAVLDVAAVDVHTPVLLPLAACALVLGALLNAWCMRGRAGYRRPAAADDDDDDEHDDDDRLEK